MHRATLRPGCVLSLFGCIRLAWHLEEDASDWPNLEVVNADMLIHSEQVYTDFGYMAERLGLRAMPSSAPDTTEERHAARFFTNVSVLFPWTTRQQHPSPL